MPLIPCQIYISSAKATRQINKHTENPKGKKKEKENQKNKHKFCIKTPLLLLTGEGWRYEESKLLSIQKTYYSVVHPHVRNSQAIKQITGNKGRY